jgi:hypothetical protein
MYTLQYNHHYLKHTIGEYKLIPEKELLSTPII